VQSRARNQLNRTNSCAVAERGRPIQNIANLVLFLRLWCTTNSTAHKLLSESKRQDVGIVVRQKVGRNSKIRHRTMHPEAASVDFWKSNSITGSTSGYCSRIQTSNDSNTGAFLGLDAGAGSLWRGVERLRRETAAARFCFSDFWRTTNAHRSPSGSTAWIQTQKRRQLSCAKSRRRSKRRHKRHPKTKTSGYCSRIQTSSLRVACACPKSRHWRSVMWRGSCCLHLEREGARRSAHHPSTAAAGRSTKTHD